MKVILKFGFLNLKEAKRTYDFCKKRGTYLPDLKDFIFLSGTIKISLKSGFKNTVKKFVRTSLKFNDRNHSTLLLYKVWIFDVWGVSKRKKKKKKVNSLLFVAYFVRAQTEPNFSVIRSSPSCNHKVTK
jgi:hypothetical protein